MIVVPIFIPLLFILLTYFLKDKFAKSTIVFSCSGALLVYFFIIGGSPWGGIFEGSLKWLKIINIDMGIGFGINPVNSLILMTLLLVTSFFSSSYLKNFQNAEIKKHVRLLLVAILLLLVGIMATEIITFFISWGALGALNFYESRKRLRIEDKNSKFFYIGMDIAFMFFGLLLLSLMFSSASFDIINEKINDVVQEEKDIIYVGFLFLSLAIFTRTLIFPFLLGYRKRFVEENVSFHGFQFLTTVPLGYVLILKINQIMNGYFFSNIFLILGITTSFIILISALTRNNAVEILNLENGSMLGMIYALLGLGQISTSIIIFITFLLLKNSINMLFLTMPNKTTSKKFFLPMVLLMGAYIGFPGLTNFFPFFDVTWAFWNQGVSFYVFMFIILNGVLHVKLLTIIFDLKKMFSSGVNQERLGFRSILALLPGLISLIMVFYCIPSNLSSTNAEIMKEKISPYLADKIVSTGSVQEQNIVMILLFFGIVVSILMGGYFYIFKENSIFLKTIKKYFFWINEFINQGQTSEKFLRRGSFQKENIWKYFPQSYLSEKMKTVNIYAEKIVVPFRGKRVETINVSLMQIFAMIAFCLLLFLLGMGWKKFI